MGMPGVCRASAVVVIGVVAVSGCTGGGSPTTTSSTSMTSSSSATSSTPTTSTPSVGPTGGVPAAARAHTEAGAQAFIRYFNDQVARAWMTPDATALAGLCMPESKSCAGYQSEAETFSAQAHRVSEAPLRIDNLETAGQLNTGYRVVMRGVQVANRVVDRKGSTISTVPQEPANYAYYVVWASGAWIIQDVKVLPS